MWRHRFCLFGVALSLVRGADRLVCTVSVCLMLLEWVTGLLRVSRDVSGIQWMRHLLAKHPWAWKVKVKKRIYIKKKLYFVFHPLTPGFCFFLSLFLLYTRLCPLPACQDLDKQGTRLSWLSHDIGRVTQRRAVTFSSYPFLLAYTHVI